MRPKVELLAPAGTWEAFETVIAAGADAVYLGGKRFNMRMHRKEFNLDENQLREAVQYAHDRNVRLYVTVNNLLSDAEVNEVESYLLFLDEIGVDAIIIQDLVILDLIQKLNLQCEIHASVMMNTSNLDSVQYLKDRGVTRVVTSREMSLEQIRTYKEQIDMEFEYFIHGDMCYAQSGQCIYGGVLFGLSSNRGRCVKPCRWALRTEGNESEEHMLAVKDMCMFFHLRELIQSGVECFKIEGRMRAPEFLQQVVSAYRAEIDQYLADPVGYVVDEARGRELYESRVRDFTTCFAFGNPGQVMIDPSGIREPRQFSHAQKEPEITDEVTAELKNRFAGYGLKEQAIAPRLTAAAPTFEHFTAALEAGVERIYVGGDAFRPARAWGGDELARAIQIGAIEGREVVYRTPSILMEREMTDLKMLLTAFRKYHLRVATGNIGVINALYAADQEFSLYGDIGLNVYNSRTFNYLKRQGLQSATLSLEAGVAEVAAIGVGSSLEVEMLVHGPVRGMVSDLCLRAEKGGFCKINCPGGFVLEDQAGCKHRVEMDQYCRNHIFLQNRLGLLPILKELVGVGVRAFRIDGTFATPDEFKEIIELYRRVIRFEYDPEVVKEAFGRLQVISQVPLTYGALVSNI